MGTGTAGPNSLIHQLTYSPSPLDGSRPGPDPQRRNNPHKHWSFSTSDPQHTRNTPATHPQHTRNMPVTTAQRAGSWPIHNPDAPTAARSPRHPLFLPVSTRADADLGKPGQDYTQAKVRRVTALGTGTASAPALPRWEVGLPPPLPRRSGTRRRALAQSPNPRTRIRSKRNCRSALQDAVAFIASPLPTPQSLSRRQKTTAAGCIQLTPAGRNPAPACHPPSNARSPKAHRASPDQGNAGLPRFRCYGQSSC
jgi:hypothetical protein